MEKLTFSVGYVWIGEIQHGRLQLIRVYRVKVMFIAQAKFSEKLFLMFLICFLMFTLHVHISHTKGLLLLDYI